MGGATEAQAIEWHENENKSVDRYVSADSCTSPGSVDIQAPSGARNIRPLSPLPGRRLSAWDLDGNQGPVQVTSAVSVGSAARFTMQPVDDWCGYFEGEFCTDGWCSTPWDTDATFWIEYQVRKRLVLKGLASRLADSAIARRFSWWYDGNVGKPARCRVNGNRARCVAVDAIGDSAVKAVVKLRLVPRAGQRPVWSYRLSARQIDEYCRYVTHDGNCVTRIKKRRSRVTLPSWVRARTVG